GALGLTSNVRSDPTVADAYNPQPTLEALMGFTYPDLTVGAGPSYPVFVDPLGAQGLSATTTIASRTLPIPPGMTTLPIPRTSLSFFNRTGLSPNQWQSDGTQIPRWFTLLDDLNFGENGLPDPMGAKLIQREGRFSWAFLCQQPIYYDNTQN